MRWIFLSRVNAKFAALLASAGIEKKELAKLAGISQGTVHAIEQGRQTLEKLPYRRAISLARVLGVTPEELVGLADLPPPSTTYQLDDDERELIDWWRGKSASERRMIRALLSISSPHSAPVVGTLDVPLQAANETPFISRAGLRTVTLRLVGDVAAGPLWDSERLGDEVEVDAGLLPDRVSLDRLAVVRVAGDSMEPTYRKGSLVIVRRCEVGEYKRGDCVIATTEEGTTMKRYAGTKKGIITLGADNAAYPAIVVPASDVTVSAIVIGVLP